MRSRTHKRKGKRRFLIFLILLVLGGVGFAAWRLLREDKQPEKKEEKVTIPCVSEDKTICKFITKWEPSTSYRFTVDETVAGVTTTTTYDYDLNNPDKIHTTVEGNPSYEVITIGNDIYTKAGETWWKKTVPQTKASRNDAAGQGRSTPEYKPVKPTHYTPTGKESCGDLQCYKYEVEDPENPELTQFIWFDDKDYKLRKLLFESADTVSEQTFEYIDVEINVPSPVQELGPNQQIKPGDPGPVAI